MRAWFAEWRRRRAIRALSAKLEAEGHPYPNVTAMVHLHPNPKIRKLIDGPEYDNEEKM